MNDQVNDVAQALKAQGQEIERFRCGLLPMILMGFNLSNVNRGY